MRWGKRTGQTDQEARPTAVRKGHGHDWTTAVSRHLRNTVGESVQWQDREQGRRRERGASPQSEESGQSSSFDGVIES